MTLREWLRDEPFDLGMSSGFFGFFAHAGMLSVLEEEGLLPERVAGASAGALVAAAWATGLGTPVIAGELERLERAHFWDPRPGPGLLSGQLFRARLEALLPVDRFESCPFPVAVSAFDLIARRTRVLDRGPLAVAVHASCAVPGLFHPVWLSGRPHVDGGTADRSGLTGLRARPRVLYHHLISSVPWRRVPFPPHPNAVTLAIEGLPRVGPYRLAEGPRALEAARAATRRALDRPVGAGLVEVAAAGLPARPILQAGLLR